MTIELRSPLPHELKKVVEFLSQHLRTHCSWSIQNEYPSVFNENNRENIRVLFQGDQIVAHAAIKYHILKTPVGLFKAAAIGSVIKSPEFRNQGHSQTFMQNCIEFAKKKGADFAILWTDLFDFYRKLDFELAGFEGQIVIDNPLQSSASHLQFLESSKVDPAALMLLYTKHTIGTLRTIEDIRQSLQIPNSRIYTAWDADGRIKAYAVEGKGADLKGYVHEWGGGVQELISLLNFIYTKNKVPITLIAPPHAQNLIRTLESQTSQKFYFGHLAMIRLLNTSELMTKTHRYAKSLGLNDFVFEKVNEKTFRFGRGPTVYETEDLKVLTQVLFGTPDSTHFDSILNPILPIPLWVWGWDSV